MSLAWQKQRVVVFEEHSAGVDNERVKKQEHLLFVEHFERSRYAGSRLNPEMELMRLRPHSMMLLGHAAHSQSLSNSMAELIFTNVSTYRAIVIEAFETMRDLVESGRRPKEDGSPGWILQFDPNRKSFKQAMIVIVFAGMWLEALLHLLIVRDHGEKKFREYDRKPYEEKLRLIGIDDNSILETAARFRMARKTLVHEKAHFDTGEMQTAQDEARNAYHLLLAIETALHDSLGS